MNPQQQLDPSVVALTKALGHQESGGDYNRIGDNGHSKGAYQWNNPTPLREGEIPANFRSFAQTVGENPDDFSPANQDRVAYKTVESWGKQGLNPAQIASKWNSGNPNAYKTAQPGYNAAQGVNYDVGQYVKNVANYYQQFQNNPQVAPKSGQSTQQEPDKQGGIVGFLRSIVSPAATMVARPIQAIAELAGVSPEAIDKFSREKLEGLVAPVPQSGADVGKDVGRGLETVALGIPGAEETSILGKTIPALGTVGGATTAGAVQGLGSGIEEGKDAEGIVRSTAGGAAGGLALGGIAKGLSNIFGRFAPLDETKAQGLVDKAKEEMTNSLTSTKTGKALEYDAREALNNAFEKGYIPEEKNGLFHTEPTHGKIKSQINLGQREKADVIKGITQKTHIEDLRKEALAQAEQRYGNDLPTLDDTKKSINSMIDDLYGIYDNELSGKELNDLQNSAKIKDYTSWQHAEDEGLRQKAKAARQIYYAINNTLDKASQGKLSPLNKSLAELHEIEPLFDPSFKGGLSGRKIKSKEMQGLFRLLTGRGKTGLVGLGATLGPMGAMAAEELAGRGEALLRPSSVFSNPELQEAPGIIGKGLLREKMGTPAGIYGTIGQKGGRKIKETLLPDVAKIKNLNL